MIDNRKLQQPLCEVEKNADFSPPSWLNKLLSLLEINSTTPIAVIYQKSDAAANRLAPHTRRMFNVILFLQGLAVLVPLLWLVVLRGKFDVSFAAFSVAFFVLCLLIISWWLRWRGMQHIWIRARLVAELTRSKLATASIDPGITADSLRRSPMLYSVAVNLASIHSQTNSLNSDVELLRDNYLIERLSNQLNYYRQKHNLALKQRQKLSRLVTVSLDAALFLAVAGVAIALRDDASYWVTWSYSDYVFGFVGTLLPLVAILAQLRGAQLELNRRIGTFAQQIELLSHAQGRLLHCCNLSELKTIVLDVEASLLSEVMEWFYQAEHNEPYYRSKKELVELKEWQVAVIQRSLFARVLASIEYSAVFFGKVIFGRIMVVALSVVFSTAVLQYQRVPQDPAIQSVLRQQDGRLYSLKSNNDGYLELWQPEMIPNRDATVVIAHGLHDGVDTDGKANHWMNRMAQVILQNSGDSSIDVVLVDWREAAKPSSDAHSAIDTVNLSALGFPEDAQAMLNDLSMIRPQGERIGELVGFKLAREIRKGRVPLDKPIHLVGHSAGGFVVLHAAIVLTELGVAPKSLKISMLDTPFPKSSDLVRFAKKYPLDFYVTSTLAQGVPSNGLTIGYRRIDIQPPTDIDPYTGAHSYAHTWFIELIQKNGAETLF